jgi:uncharacterized SAM-binding protein YcdF (DUF218 family)
MGHDERRRRGRRVTIRVVLVVLVVGAAFSAITARLFVWPARGAPTHADAIVMLGGHGPRLDEALVLARAHIAPNLVISQGATSQYCPPATEKDGVTIICFHPKPRTTQGEAEYVGRLAAQNHWRSLVLVTTRPQDTRARLRMGRCFNGDIHVATAPLPKHEWPFAIAYEWGALLKALVWQRSC